MNPTIAVACISGGVGAVGIVSTVVTAWIGSRNTRRATEQAIAAGAANTRTTLAAAREDRLWERRCAAYEETLAEVQQRQSRRRLDLANLANLDWGTITERDSFVPQDPGIRARLVAYASDDVLVAFNAITNADAERLTAEVELSNLTSQIGLAKKSGRLGDAPETKRVVAAKDHLDQASASATWSLIARFRHTLHYR